MAKFKAVLDTLVNGKRLHEGDLVEMADDEAAGFVKFGLLAPVDEASSAKAVGPKKSSSKEK